MSLSRADRSGLAAWWWTIDRVAVSIMLAILAIGIMLAFAASPAATGGLLSAGNFLYAWHQSFYAVIALFILWFTSTLSLRSVKLTAAVVFALALIGSMLAILLGSRVLGARRWIDLGFMTVQPSEFLKPGFAVLAASILADKAKMILPKPVITLLLIAPAVIILLLQPDVGQTALMLSLWGALLFVYGVSAIWINGLAGSVMMLVVGAYFTFGYVHHRVQQFLGSGGFQTQLSLEAFARGGLFGVGPGAGTIKYRLPDANSDFIFAVAGEEFGLVLCGLIAVLFCVLAVRLLMRSAQARDPFSQIAGAGLAIVVALQAFINMGVAISLLPAKGMTLPFISYGGSSLFAIALSFGFALAVTRQRPKIGHEDHDVFTFLRETPP